MTRPWSIVDVLRDHALRRPDHLALVVLPDGETEQARLTYAQLDAQVRTVAARMQAENLTGQRVLLMLNTSVDYLVGFLACLYAGAIAVPLSPPTRASHRERVDHVLVDCTPSAAIVHEEDLVEGELGDCRLWTVDRLTDAEYEWEPPDVASDELAYLQYTSGSTSDPKGVMVTHENLTHQIAIFSAGLDLTEDDTVVSWLPLFHDFGLVAGLMMPLTLGGTTVKMPPPVFVQRPFRWLSAISRYRGTASFSPNFPLDLCADRITDAEKSTLDLSSWRVLGLGAEPIRWGTLRRFSDAFASCGFNPRALRTVYGMAEATLVVIVSPAQDGGPTAIDIDAAEFAEGRLRQKAGDVPGAQWQKLLGNGTTLGDSELLIVDPGTGEPMPEGGEGEIWMRGKTVCPGYWDRPEATAETFGAYLADGRGPFLRSGDLGAMVSGEVYITGRLKDLIIIRGRNVHPQDIELTSAQAHRALNRGVCVAFSVDRDGEERLVIAHELKRAEFGRHDPSEVVRAIRGAVAEEHEVAVDTVVLLRPRTMPLTTSGKLRRRYSRQLFIRGELPGERVCGPEPDDGAAVAQDTVVAWLRARVSALTGLAVDEVGVDATFGAFGLDSVTQTTMTGDLAAELGRTIDPTLVYSHPTIARFAAALGATASRQTPAPVVVPAETHEPVAVVGMACEFPGAPALEQFWELLIEGRDAVTEAPADRWPMNGHGGFLPDVAGFDARFFGISADEAANMDPQQRLLLSNAWRALEDAGIPVESIAGTPGGVFVGIHGTDYRQLQTRDAADPVAYTGTGTALSIAANRLSYFFDLTGPSLAVDTACSSSLVATHQAVSSLRRGECDLALVAGVNLLLDSDLTSAFAAAGMLSPDGRCHTFDVAANGYVRGEGCGVLVLKRLGDARRDNDRVRAVIAGSAVNQDGRANTLTAPNGLAQKNVIRQALAAAGISPDEIGHVEAHGTGTSLGDPIEMAGISDVYGSGASEPVWVGSVKTNIGHLEAAAGIAGLIKTVLAVERRTVPAHLHLTELNPLIQLDGFRCRVPTQTVPWEHARRVGGVSSFGFGGTNAHVIVSEAPQPPTTAPVAEDGGWRLLPISAQSDWALGELVDATADLLDETDGSSSFAVLTRAAARRRSHLGHRVLVVARSKGESVELLRAHRRGEPSGLVVTGTARHGGPGPTAFLFPGQGFQQAGMARPFYSRHRVFREAAEYCDAVARAELGVSLLPSVAGTPGELVDLDQTRFGQPAMFLVHYALAQTWQSYGVHPDVVLGHSLGEYAAACVAGVLTVADAMRLVLTRARLMQETPPGAMYAIHSERPEELLGTLDHTDDVVVAAINGPEDFTISGTETAAGQVAELCRRHGAKVSRLAVTRAFHSSLMDPVATELAREAASVKHHAPRIPVVTNLTGEVLGDEPPDARHWALQLRQPVRFADGVNTLAELGVRCVVELSPEPMLTPLAQRGLPNATWLTSGHRGNGDDRQLMASLGRWYVDGGTVDFTALDPTDPAPAPVTLPGHPLRPVRHWYRAGIRRNTDPGATGHPLVGTHADLVGATKDHYVGTIETGQPWFVDQHRLFDTPVLPGSAVIEWILGVARAKFGDGSAWLLENVQFTAFLPLPDNRSVPTQAVVDGNSVTCFAKDDDTNWQERARVGTVRAGGAFEPGPTPDELDADAAEVPIPALYERFVDNGVTYGPAFRAVRSLWRGDRVARGHIEVTERGPGDDAYVLHPVVLDACFHVAAALMGAAGRPLVPVSVDRLQVAGALPAKVTCDAWVVDDRTVNLQVVADGAVVVDVRGLALRPVSENAVMPRPPLRALVTEWVPVKDKVRSLDLAGETWLVLGPNAATAQRRITELNRAGARSLCAVVSYPAGLDTVVEKLRPELATLTGIVVDAGPGGDGPDHVAAMARGTTLPLGRLLAAEPTARPAVVVCSHNAAAVVGSTPNPAQAATTALTKTLIAEYPALRVVQVDDDIQDDAPVPIAEVLSHARAQEASGHLAVRDGRWYRAELRSERLQPRNVALRPDAGYLITGGWGALGRVTAERLVALGARRLVLAGRTPPDKDTAWLTELRDAGAEVSLRSVDLGKDEAVRELVASVSNLRGVVHAGGTTDDGLLADLDWPRFQKVLAPKANGAWSLHRHTAGQPLDFFVLYSSLAALIGNPGQANYVLANAFLDGLAQARRHAGVAATSINWGPWAEGGLATRPGLLAELERTGIYGIADAEGAGVLDHALTNDHAQLGLATVDWTRFVAATGRTDTLLADLAPVASPTSVGIPATKMRELAVADPTAADQHLTEMLLAETSVLLGLSPAQREELRPTFGDVPFNTLGLDSLMAVRLRNKLFDYLAVDIPSAVLFDVGTASDVARIIRDRVTAQAVLATEAADPTADHEVFRI
ncbi:type I polyketide synthase [Actinophytocola sp.]|uniref:type I polyketide synthase n=1 Tax=Actinophytocola sp. TaxID=1872138 RepID=UPI003D6A8447